MNRDLQKKDAIIKHLMKVLGIDKVLLSDKELNNNSELLSVEFNGKRGYILQNKGVN